MTEPTEVPRATGLAMLDQIEAHRRNLPAKLARLDSMLASVSEERRSEVIAQLPAEIVESYFATHALLDFLDAAHNQQGETL